MILFSLLKRPACLNEFCSLSGQSISLTKSKLFVSPNCSRQLARNISALCGIPLTSDLGKYLGVPLLHQRVTKATYYHILEKVQARLAGWKTAQLSLAGRTLLIQSVTSSIPLYTMQTTKLPESINSAVDKCHRQFLWGDTDTKKKIHLVGWNRVCKPKDHGGLDIKQMTKLNGSLLAKVGWKIMTEQDALWVKVVKGKSLSNSNFLECRANAQSSYTWRSVIKGQDVLKRGLKWVIGNGRTVKFWIDVWIGNAPLSTAAMGPISLYKIGEMGKLVVDYVDEYGHWNWDAIGD